jgi:hypothetical protein
MCLTSAALEGRVSSWSACLMTAESLVRQPLGPRRSSAAALAGSCGDDYIEETDNVAGAPRR